MANLQNLKRKLYKNPILAFYQFQYIELDDAATHYLTNKRYIVHFLTPTIIVYMRSLPKRDQKLELARFSAVFTSIFRVKPTVRPRPAGGYIIFSNLHSLPFCIWFNYLYYIKFRMQTRLLRLTAATNKLFFTLQEPLTFFPVRRSTFDFHDWNVSLLFELSSCSSSIIKYFYVPRISLENDIAY